jgi:uncharacterized Zn finger protein
MGRYDYGWPEYVSVAEKKAKAEKKLAQLSKKDPSICPVIITGNKIAHSWWGKAWNANLERYSDYSNRIGRGRSYVRNGAVLDLRIEKGEIRGLVQGSRTEPYTVLISITPLAKKTWDEIRSLCAGKLSTLSELLVGSFPKDLNDLFTATGNGLFPTPKEIGFECSCPDWASMCKHVAAVLYGVGARLDNDPSLFFVLRNIDMNDLIAQTLDHESKKLLDKSGVKSSRVIDDADVAGMFGIEMTTGTHESADTNISAVEKNISGKSGSKTKRVASKKRAPAAKSIPLQKKTAKNGKRKKAGQE